MVFLNSTVGFLPKLAAAIILLLIGWLVGVVVGKIVKEILVRLKVDKYVGKGKPILKISEVFPLIFEWLIYLVFIQAAVQALGIPALVAFIGMLVGFIPGLIGGVIVVIVGYAIAEYVKSKVEESGMAYSGMMSKALFWLLIYVAVALALPLVGINASLINNILLISVGAVGVGIAIALGLGLKETVATLAKKYVNTGKRR